METRKYFLLTHWEGTFLRVKGKRFSLHRKKKSVLLKARNTIKSFIISLNYTMIQLIEAATWILPPNQCQNFQPFFLLAYVDCCSYDLWESFRQCFLELLNTLLVLWLAAETKTNFFSKVAKSELLNQTKS